MANMLGATVILPNVRGSDGYGKRYLNLDNGPKREDSVKDIGALLDWIARQPDLDASKVAVYGQSYGGYMSLAVMTHYSDRLVGGVERYGISDFITFLNNTEAYRRDNRRAEYGDERDPAMRAVFQRIKPMANVGKIKKPMLVMQGANDPRVPKSESDQVVAGIRAKRHRGLVRGLCRRRPRLPKEAQQRPPPRSRDGVPTAIVRGALRLNFLGRGFGFVLDPPQPAVEQQQQRRDQREAGEHQRHARRQLDRSLLAGVEEPVSVPAVHRPADHRISGIERRRHQRPGEVAAAEVPLGARIHTAMNIKGVKSCSAKSVNFCKPVGFQIDRNAIE